MNETKNTPGKLDLTGLIKNYANYNLWANKQLVDWLKTKPVSVMKREVPSSFPSLILTLKHMWKTQLFWLAVLNRTHESLTYEEFDGTLDELFEGFISQSQEFADYVNSLDETALTESSYLKTPWFEADLPRFEFIQHCMNHSTYHRGQLVTIGRNVELTDAPMTDYNFYNIMITSRAN
jgi:uncharacterized damage-inducible protein DinB